MDTHKNARLTPKGREEMVRAVVEQRLSKAAAARQFNTTPKTVAKWVARFRAQGVVGLRDRSSRPLSSPSQIPPATADAVERLRRQRRTQEHIAAELGISKASVSRILKRRGLSLLSSLEPQEPRPRYEREKPGEIIHLDIKKLGRFNSIGHRITGRRDRPLQQPRRRLGVRPRRDRRSFPRRPRRHLPGPEEGKRRHLPLRHHRLLQKPRRHGRARHDRQRKLLPIQSLRARLQAARRQAHHEPNPIRRRPTARPSASSRPRSENGPTPLPSSTQNNDAAPCRLGYIATTGTGPMLASGLSAASTVHFNLSRRRFVRRANVTIVDPAEPPRASIKVRIHRCNLHLPAIAHSRAGRADQPGRAAAGRRATGRDLARRAPGHGGAGRLGGGAALRAAAAADVDRRDGRRRGVGHRPRARRRASARTPPRWCCMRC